MRLLRNVPRDPTKRFTCARCARAHPLDHGWDNIHHPAPTYYCTNCAYALGAPMGPDCGHSACRQNYIDTGAMECVLLGSDR